MNTKNITYNIVCRDCGLTEGTTHSEAKLKTQCYNCDGYDLEIEVCIDNEVTQ